MWIEFYVLTMGEYLMLCALWNEFRHEQSPFFVWKLIKPNWQRLIRFFYSGINLVIIWPVEVMTRRSLFGMESNARNSRGWRPHTRATSSVLSGYPALMIPFLPREPETVVFVSSTRRQEQCWRMLLVIMVVSRGWRLLQTVLVWFGVGERMGWSDSGTWYEGKVVTR